MKKTDVCILSYGFILLFAALYFNGLKGLSLISLVISVVGLALVLPANKPLLKISVFDVALLSVQLIISIFMSTSLTILPLIIVSLYNIPFIKAVKGLSYGSQMTLITLGVIGSVMSFILILSLNYIFACLLHIDSANITDNLIVPVITLTPFLYTFIYLQISNSRKEVLSI